MPVFRSVYSRNIADIAIYKGQYSNYFHMYAKYIVLLIISILLLTGSDDKGTLGVGRIPDPILLSRQYMQYDKLHNNCIEMNVIGW